jgi:hypothetical protein
VALAPASIDSATSSAPSGTSVVQPRRRPLSPAFAIRNGVRSWLATSTPARSAAAGPLRYFPNPLLTCGLDDTISVLRESVMEILAM